MCRKNISNWIGQKICEKYEIVYGYSLPIFGFEAIFGTKQLAITFRTNGMECRDRLNLTLVLVGHLA